MRILLLAHCYAHSNANTFRYRHLCEQLVRQGHTIDVIGDKPLKDPISPQGVNYYALRKDWHRTSAWLPIFWFTLVEFFKLSALWTASLRHPYTGYTVLLNGTARYRINCQLRANSYDVVIMSVVPWTFYTFADKLSQAAPLIVDISDPLYKNAFVDSNPAGNKRFARFEAKALKHASHVVVMSEPLVDLYIRELNIPSHKITFVSPATATADYIPGAPHSYAPHSPLTILYAGSLYPGYRDLDQVLAAIRQVPDTRLTVVSQQRQEPEPNVVYRHWIPQAALKQLYDSSDILLFVDNFYGYQIPSKIFELIATNKPILFVYDCRNRYLYDKLNSQKGILFVRNDSKEIAAGIRQLCRLQRLEVRYTFDLSAYSNESTTNRLIDIIHHVQR